MSRRCSHSFSHNNKLYYIIWNSIQIHIRIKKNFLAIHVRHLITWYGICHAAYNNIILMICMHSIWFTYKHIRYYIAAMLESGKFCITNFARIPKNGMKKKTKISQEKPRRKEMKLCIENNKLIFFLLLTYKSSIWLYMCHVIYISYFSSRPHMYIVPFLWQTAYHISILIQSTYTTTPKFRWGKKQLLFFLPRSEW